MDEAVIRAALERVLESEGFTRSQRSSELLRYVVESTLRDPDGAITGTTIAQDVFGRGSEFDASSDPIARVQMRRVRLLLDTYYSEIAPDDPLEIQIPKGAYRPRYTERRGGPAAPPDDTPAEPQPLGEPEADVRVEHPAPVGPKRRPAPVFIAAIVLVGVLLLGAAGATWFWPWNARQDAAFSASILVNPLANRTGDEANEIFEVGLQHQIAADLQRFEGLKVGLQSAEDAPSDSNFELRGNILKLADGVDLLFEVFDRESNKLVWHRRVTRADSGDDYFDSLQELSAAVVAEIGSPHGALGRWVLKSNVEHTAPESEPSKDTFLCLAMFEGFIQSRTLDRVRAVRSCIEQVLIEEPNEGSLIIIEAWLMTLASPEVGQIDVPELEGIATLQRGVELAHKAVEVDPGDARAHALLGLIENVRGNRDAAIAALRRALELNPRSSDILAHIARMEAYDGDWEAARKHYTAALKYAANPPRWYYHPVMQDLLVNGTPEEALEATEQGRGETWFGPVFRFAAAALAGRDDLVEAMRPSMLSFVEKQGGDPLRGNLREADPELILKITEGFNKGGIPIENGSVPKT